MATAAFKSNSRRGNTSSENSNSPKKAPPQRMRRSLSVSALPRTELDIPSDFMNKRDNPLFWGTSSSPPGKEEVVPDNSPFSNNAETLSKSSGGLTAKGLNATQRGRSVTRSSDAGTKKKIDRSVSRVDTNPRGRSVSRVDTNLCNRSVSRGPPVYGASESEKEHDTFISSNFRKNFESNRGPSNVKRSNSFTNWVASRQETRSSRCNSHTGTVDSDADYALSSSNTQIPNWEDGILAGSSSEAEEKTIKAVCEQMKSFQGDNLTGDTATQKIYETVRSEVRRAISDIQSDLQIAIRGKSTTAIGPAEVTDIPPDLVKPGAEELILDIRREYAKKLEESQERAKKLRSDLAAEEYREQELTRILKETLPNPNPNPNPNPKTSAVHRSRLGRRTSTERKKMSRRLTEEAMSYFDECVSISTFDSSDFSAPEDPPLNSIGASVPVGHFSPSYGTNNFVNHNQESISHDQLMHKGEDSGLTASSISNEPTIDEVGQRSENTELSRKSQFFFGRKPAEAVSLHQDIRSYIKHFEKEVDKDGTNSEIVRSDYSKVSEYDVEGRAEKLLFDRVFFKNRTASGSLHLCGGCIAISFSPFASII